MLSAAAMGAPREGSVAVATRGAAVRAREAAEEAAEVEGSGVPREAAVKAREVVARARAAAATARAAVARVVVVWAVVAKEGEGAALLEELPAGEVDGRVETEMAEVAMEV